MERTAYLSIKRLREMSRTIKDPRRSWGNKRHELVEILSIALLALMGGADSWEDLTLFGKAKKNLLRTVFELKNGIPSPDTFRRVISRIESEKLEVLYRQWVRPYVGSCLQKQICVDCALPGKMDSKTREKTERNVEKQLKAHSSCRNREKA